MVIIHIQLKKYPDKIMFAEGLTSVQVSFGGFILTIFYSVIGTVASFMPFLQATSYITAIVIGIGTFLINKDKYIAGAKKTSIYKVIKKNVIPKIIRRTPKTPGSL